MYQDNAHQYNVPYFLQPPIGTPLYNPYAYRPGSSSLDGALNETQFEEADYSLPHTRNVYNLCDHRGSFESQSDMSDVETSAPTCYSYHWQPAAMDNCWQNRVPDESSMSPLFGYLNGLVLIQSDRTEAGFFERSSRQELQCVPLSGDGDTYSYSLASQDVSGAQAAQSRVGYISCQTVPVCLEKQDNHTVSAVLPLERLPSISFTNTQQNNIVVLPSDPYDPEHPLGTPVEVRLFKSHLTSVPIC